MRITWAAIFLTLVVAGTAEADEACTDFKWDVGRERALFAGTHAALVAGRDAGSAPAVAPGHAYAVTLSPQQHVSFSATPGKSPGDRPGFGGMLALQVPAAGDYRVSLDAPLWVDMVLGTSILSPTDFQGQHACEAPHKIVVFRLEAGRVYWVQLSNSAQQSVTVALTPAPERKT